MSCMVCCAPILVALAFISVFGRIEPPPVVLCRMVAHPALCGAEFLPACFTLKTFAAMLAMIASSGRWWWWCGWFLW